MVGLDFVELWRVGDFGETAVLDVFDAWNPVPPFFEVGIAFSVFVDFTSWTLFSWEPEEPEDSVFVLFDTAVLRVRGFVAFDELSWVVRDFGLELLLTFFGSGNTVVVSS